MHIRDYEDAGRLIERYKEVRGLQDFLRQFPGSEVHVRTHAGDGVGVPARLVTEPVNELVREAVRALEKLGVQV